MTNAEPSSTGDTPDTLSDASQASDISDTSQAPEASGASDASGTSDSSGIAGALKIGKPRPSAPYFMPKLIWGDRLNVTTRMWWLMICYIAALQLFARIMVLTAHGFYWDDFIIVGKLYDAPLLSTDYLLQSHDGHLAPLSFLVQGIYQQLAPWAWWLPALTMVLMALATTYAMAKLMELITGRTLVSLFLIAGAAWTPLMLPGDTWWSAAINGQPFRLAFIVFLIATIRITVRRDSGPRSWEAVGLFVLVAVALGFFEKSAAIAPVSLAIIATIAYMERKSFVQVLRRGLSIWVPTILLTGAWAAWYYFGATHTTTYLSKNLQPELFFNGLGQIFVGIIGGPTTWERWAPGQPFATAPSALIAIGGIVLLLLSAILIGRDYRGWAPWTLSVAYIFATLFAITAFRSGENTSGLLAHTLHYYADVALVMFVGVGVSLAGTPPENETPAPLPKRTHILIWGLGTVLAVTSTVSVVTYRSAWSDDTAMEWLATTKTSLSELKAQADSADAAEAIDYNLLDQPIPFEILVPVAAPMNLYSHVFYMVDDRPPFERVTGHPRMFDASGTLIDAKVSEVTRVVDGDVEQCGHRITVGDDGTVSQDISLANIIKLGDWVLEFPATASEDMDVRLSLPNPFETAEQTMQGSTVVKMNNELRPRYVYLNGGGNILHIDIENATPGATLCMGTGAIGPLVPANG